MQVNFKKIIMWNDDHAVAMFRKLLDLLFGSVIEADYHINAVPFFLVLTKRGRDMKQSLKNIRDWLELIGAVSKAFEEPFEKDKHTERPGIYNSGIFEFGKQFMSGTNRILEVMNYF